MKRSNELKQERASKIAAQSLLLKLLTTDKRDSFNETEQKSFDSLEGEISNLTADIDNAAALEKAQERNALILGQAPVSMVKSESEAKDKRALSKRASITTAIRSATNGAGLNGAEKEMNELAIEESRAAGIEVPENSKVNIPMSFLRAVGQTVSEDSGNYGGALVTDQAPRVQEKFAAGGVLAMLGANTLTLTGGDLPLPVMGDYNFSWLKETDAITLQKSEISGPKLSPKRLGAAVDLSNRLLVQTSVSAESMVRSMLVKGYDRAIDSAGINGSGLTVNPLGILNNPDVLSSEAAAAVVPTKALVAELIKLVETANATDQKLSFLGNPTIKYLLETTKLDAGSGRFLMDTMNQLLGYNFMSSTLVPDLAGNSPLIYGDFSQMFIGQWGSLSVLSDPYSGSLSNSVRVVVNGHADIAIAQPSAFSVNKFFNAESGSEE